jgi:hypothetical protein
MTGKIKRAIAATTIILPTLALAIVFAHSTIDRIHAEQATAAVGPADTPYGVDAADEPFGEE